MPRVPALLVTLIAAAAVPGDARRELGTRLLEFERRLAVAPLDRADRERLDAAFDRLSLAFFLGNLPAAAAALDDRIAELAGFTADERLLLAYRLRSASALPRGTPTCTVRLESAYAFEPDTPIALNATLELLDGAGARVAAVPLALVANEDGTEPVEATLQVAPPGLGAGTYRIVLAAQARRIEVATLEGYARPFDLERAELLARLLAREAVGAPAPVLAIARGRATKLRDRPIAGDNFPLITPMSRLLDELRGEVAAIERGDDPYRLRAGEWWRSIETARGAVIPLRIHAPAAVVDVARSQPAALPLIVALHGMGGDEAMFFHAYGAGVIKSLAAERGCIVVAPSTYPLVRDGALLATIVEAVAASYPIDRDRIHLIGHSLGAGTAMTAAQACPGLVASLALFGGGATQARSSLPPTLLFIGERDAIVPRARFAAWIEDPPPGVTVRVLPRHGHTLMVGEHLGEALDFLLAPRTP